MSTREPSEFRLEFHTDDPAMRELAECYWAFSRRADGRIAFTYRVVEDLAPRFGLRPTAASVTGPAMAAASAFYGQCPRCGQEMRFPHRTAFQQDYLSFGGGLPCKPCREELRRAEEEQRRAATAARRRAIQREYHVEPAETNVSAMTLKDAVFSLAVLRASRFTGAQLIGAADAFTIPLSPHPQLDREILVYLYGRKLFNVDPASEESSFDFDERGTPRWYYPLKVRWLLRDPHPSQFIKRLESLFGRRTYPASWNADLATVSKQIAVYECLDVLTRGGGGLRFELPGGWADSIADAFDICSVSQVQPLILRVLREFHRSRMSAGMTAKELGEEIIASVMELVRRVRVGRENAESVPRYSDCPRSAISFVLYDVLLRTGDGGFTSPPGSFRLPQENAPPLAGSHRPPVMLNAKMIHRVIELSKREQDDSASAFIRNGEPATRSPLLVYLAGLSAADRAQVAAVMLIGRGDERAEEFAEVVREWTQPLEWTQAEYLAGKRALWKFLESGLEALEGIPTGS